MPNIAVLVSGAGSNLDAILKYRLPVKLVVADRKCLALQIAMRAKIPVRKFFRPFTKGFNRELFTLNMVEQLRKTDIDLIVMAGFMTLLSPVIYDLYPRRMLNLHPSLFEIVGGRSVAKYKGAHAPRDALRAGEKVTGCTVHVVEGVDEGRVLATQEVSILETDDEKTLHERIKLVEHEIYPKAIAEYIQEIF